MNLTKNKNIIIYLIALLVVPVLFSGSVVYAEEKVLNLATASEPPTVDPALATDTTSGSVIDNVFETLTKVNKEGEIIPGAAASWEVSEDGTVYTFHLQPEGKWSNGESVTAKDFEYSWKRLLNPETGSQRGNLYYVIKGAKAYHEEDGALEEVGIKAVDDHTLEVTLVAPAAYFLEQVSHYAFAPVYQSAVEGNDAWAAEAGEDFVTNGPFVLSEWTHQADYTLTPNEHYWDRDKVSLDRVNVQVVESETTANTAFQAGDFDYIGAPYSTVATDFIQLYKNQDQLSVEPISSIYWYKVNTTDPIMQNVNIR
ncbi:peptide ABC transporter substrate-binding protein, partial [Dolosicoccus paucivorans]